MARRDSKSALRAGGWKHWNLVPSAVSIIPMTRACFAPSFTGAQCERRSLGVAERSQDLSSAGIAQHLGSDRRRPPNHGALLSSDLRKRGLRASEVESKIGRLFPKCILDWSLSCRPIGCVRARSSEGLPKDTEPTKVAGSEIDRPQIELIRTGSSSLDGVTDWSRKLLEPAGWLLWSRTFSRRQDSPPLHLRSCR